MESFAQGNVNKTEVFKLSFHQRRIHFEGKLRETGKEGCGISQRLFQVDPDQTELRRFRRKLTGEKETAFQI